MAEPLNATFFAFRKREQGGVLLRATIAFVIVALALLAAFGVVFAASLAPAANWYADMLGAAVEQDPQVVEGMGLPPNFGALIGGVLLWCFFFAVLYAAYEAACLRWLVRGETGGLMGLTLGADTWRVYFSYWMWFLLYMGFSIVMGIAIAVIVGVLAVSSGGNEAAAASGILAGYALMYALMIYFAVRFAPAAATSIARRKFAFFDAWTVTKGRFWALFGSFFLLFLINFIVGIVVGAIWFITVLGTAAPDWTQIRDLEGLSRFQIEMTQAYIRSFTQPGTWVVIGVLQLVSWLVGVLVYVGMFGVNARAAQAALQEGKITAAA